MFGIGTGELLLLLVIALLVLGPERMPKLARDLGKTVSDLRRTSDELRSEFLNADRTLRAEKLLDVAAASATKGSGEAAAKKEEPASAPDTGKAAEIGATVGESATTTEAAPPDAGATRADVAADASEPPPIPPEPEETVFDREVRLARERIDRGG